MDPCMVLSAVGGVARWTELEKLGVARRHLLDAVAAGDVLRPHRGCYCLPGTPRHDVLAVIFRAHRGCLTRCIEAGLPVYPAPDTIHLCVPQSRGLGLERLRPTNEVVLHRHLRRDSLAAHIDLAALCVGPLQQLVLVDAALRKGAMTRAALAGFRFGTEARREWLKRRCDGRAQSMAETFARVHLIEAGLSLTPQQWFDRVGLVDLLVEGRVVVELDGKSYHSDAEAFGRDRDRDRILAVQDIRTLRYTFFDAIERPQEIVRDVEAVLWRMGAMPPLLRPPSGPRLGQFEPI